MVKVSQNWLSDPVFFTITDPNLAPASLEITHMALNMILGKENGSW